MAGDQWYYAKGDQKRGPVTTAQLKELAAKGDLASSDLIWKEGMAEWTAASKAKGLFPQQAEPPPLPSQEAGPPPLPTEAGPPSLPPGRRPGGAGPGSSKGFWGSMFDHKREEAWTGGQMAVLIIGTLLVGLFGLVMGILGARNKARRTQGIVLIVIGALAILFALGGTGAMQEGGSGGSGPQKPRHWSQAQWEEHLARDRALKQLEEDMKRQREQNRRWQKMSREPVW